tara:strand:- start:46562 stop:47350 length:789 start_codon:yes stop_codon:yes gene_type:complete
MLNQIKLFDVNKKKKRCGPRSDGGYILLDQISRNTDTLFCFGVENNIDFELEFINKYKPKKNILFDHTINNLPKKKLKKMKFIKKGLSDIKSKKYVTLDEITKNSLNDNILKMDIEYDEWKIFKKVSTKTLLKFKMIIVEFHFFFLNLNDVDTKNILTPYFKNFSINNYKKINQMLLQKYHDVLEKLNQNFIPFHLSANNSLPLKKVKGKFIPQLLEFSYVRKDLISKFKISTKTLPIKNLDYPNKPYKPDFKNFYPFKSYV